MPRNTCHKYINFVVSFVVLNIKQTIFTETILLYINRYHALPGSETLTVFFLQL